MAAVADAAAGQIFAILIGKRLRDDLIGEKELDLEPIGVTGAPHPAKRLLAGEGFDVADDGVFRRLA
jgi:hypothetical protein